MNAACWWLALAQPEIAAEAHHHVAVVDETVRVECIPSRAHVGEALALAVPLPAAASSDDAPVRDDEGRIVALTPDASGHLHASLPLATVLAQGVLPLPIVRGTEIHRLVIDPEIDFRAAPELGLVTHMGHTTPAGLDRAERARVDARLPVARPRVGVIYIDTAAAVREGGVFGRVERRADRQRRAAVVAGVVFAFVCGAAIAGHRRLRKAVAYERAAQELAAEFDALPRTDTGVRAP